MEVCVTCEKPIRKQQHYLRCTLCRESTHRCCGNKLNIDVSQYRKIQKGEFEFILHCKKYTESCGGLYKGDVQILSPVSFHIAGSIF